MVWTNVPTLVLDFCVSQKHGTCVLQGFVVGVAWRDAHIVSQSLIPECGC